MSLSFSNQTDELKGPLNGLQRIQNCGQPRKRWVFLIATCESRVNGGWGEGPLPSSKTVQAHNKYHTPSHLFTRPQDG